ncbi:MAG: M14 family metallopeptidase [Planctomycetota bacterium]
MKTGLYAIFVLLTLGITSVTSAQPKRFDGHRVVHVTVNSPADVAQLAKLDNNDEDFDVEWHSVGTGVAEVRIGPDQMQALDDSNLNYSVVIDDLQAVLDQNAALPIAGGSFFSDFRHYDAHVNYLADLADQYPDLAQMINLGESLEGQPIWAIRISGNGEKDKPGVLYHACEHAREWITPPVVTYLAEHLLTQYESDASIRAIVDQVEWFLIPVMNPDGYNYSWSSNRYWRKNRRDNMDGNHGVDLNRNWPDGWGGPGSSASTQSNTYHGTEPFSEPETRVIRDFLLEHPNIKAHLDIHSYGSLCLWPFGKTEDLPQDQPLFQYLGQRIRDLIAAVHGREYEIGTVANALYLASGISVDWIYSHHGIWSFTLELRGSGFSVPPSHILLACEENLPAMLFLAQWISDCDGNGVADTAELADGSAPDCNHNSIVDICEPLAPCMPPATAPLGSRYLTVQVPPVDEPVAIHVSSPSWECLDHYVDVDGTLTDTPVHALPSTWGIATVADDRIVPETVYKITALTADASSPTSHAQTFNFGDVDGNGLANIADLQECVLGFQGQFDRAPLEAMDLYPCLPDGLITLEDLLQIVTAFRGSDYDSMPCSPPCP